MNCSGPCEQGRKECPTPQACRIVRGEKDEGPSAVLLSIALVIAMALIVLLLGGFA